MHAYLCQFKQVGQGIVFCITITYRYTYDQFITYDFKVDSQARAETDQRQ